MHVPFSKRLGCIDVEMTLSESVVPENEQPGDIRQLSPSLPLMLVRHFQRQPHGFGSDQMAGQGRGMESPWLERSTRRGNLSRNRNERTRIAAPLSRKCTSRLRESVAYDIFVHTPAQAGPRSWTLAKA